MMQSFFTNLSTLSLFAHEGHGHAAAGQGSTLWHYVTEPQHAWVFAVLVAVAIAAVLMRPRSRVSAELE